MVPGFLQTWRLAFRLNSSIRPENLVLYGLRVFRCLLANSTSTEHTTIPIDGVVVEQVESFKFLGIHINKLMVQAHQDSCEEGTTKPIPPQETEKMWHGLHHYLVWQLLGLRPQGTTEGSAYGTVHHWGQASCHPGPLYQAVSEKGPKKKKS